MSFNPYFFIHHPFIDHASKAWELAVTSVIQDNQLSIPVI